MKRSLLTAIAVALLGIFPQAANAHPLGNFTINHLTETAFTRDGVTVRYVLDMAEIPAYQTMREISPSGKLDDAQLSAWALRTGAASMRQIVLTVDGKPLALHLTAARARTRPGAGGLPTLYLTADARAALASSHAARAFRLEDATYPGRLGWRDAIVVPETEPTSELTAYPGALLGSPRATAILTGTVDAGGAAHVLTRSDAASAAGAPTGNAAPVNAVAESLARSNQLSDMIARGTGNWQFVALTFLVAIVLGALHALEPGHGKTLLAISLVGARATVKQAAILAGALTIAHTIGVLALGLALNIFKGYFVPETIYPWITLVSGIVIAIIGARAIAREVRRRRLVHTHDGSNHAHVHGVHTHDHGAGAHAHADHADLDDAEHALLHAIPGTAPMRFGPTVWAAMSGGVAPCPAALVVLLAAVALNQTAYGVFVIVAFSVGLAGTLTGLGIAVVRGASWLQRRPQFDRFVQYGPLVSAGVISAIGAVMVGQGFAERGVTAPPVAISGAVLLAIAGYVLSHPFSHTHSHHHGS